MNREIGRLKMSLDAAEPGLEKLVFLHYPPVYTGTSAPEIVATLKDYGIRRCFYGHLHGNAIRYAVQGECGRHPLQARQRRRPAFLPVPHQLKADRAGKKNKKSKFGLAIVSGTCYNKF